MRTFWVLSITERFQTSDRPPQRHPGDPAFLEAPPAARDPHLHIRPRVKRGSAVRAQRLPPGAGGPPSRQDPLRHAAPNAVGGQASHHRPAGDQRGGSCPAAASEGECGSMEATRA